MNASSSDVGVIGTGTMGSRMVQRLVSGGFNVKTHDIDNRANEVAAQFGAIVLDSSVSVAEATDLCLMSLPMPSDVRDVVAGGQGLLAASSPPTVIVDLSTTDPSTTSAMAAECRSRGVEYLDAPVLGRPHKCGSWTLPVGGEIEALESVTPALSQIAARLVHVGPSGVGHAVKLLNNMLFGAINASVVEAFTLAGRVGLDPRLFFQTVTESNAASASNLLLEIGPKIINRDWNPDFSIDLLRKDIKLVISMADDAGVPLPTARAVDFLNEWGHSAGLGDLDTSALAQVFESDRRER